MTQMDFTQHNEEVKQVWEAYRAGKPIRTPVLLSGNSRIWVLDPDLNRAGLTWEQFATDPEVMFNTQLKFRHYWAHTIPQDAEMGVPEKNWLVWVEFHNVVEEAWFGSQVIYPPGQVVASLPAFTGKDKERVFERGAPGAFEGIFGRMKTFYDYFVEQSKTFEYCGKPVTVYPPAALGTDGPFTIATGVRGTEILEDILVDEDYYHRLMTFITDATIVRIRAWRDALGLEARPAAGGLADDAIQFLSLRTYCEKVLPYHQRIMDELYAGGPHGMHLCGDVQRLMPTIVKELNVHSFDTGYPLDFTRLRDEVGDEVEIYGGVPVGALQTESAAAVGARARAILASGIRRGGKFVLKEANNLPPRVPLANLWAMYEAAREGRGDETGAEE